MTLKEVEGDAARKYGGSGRSAEEQALKASNELLHQAPYSQSEVEQAVGIPLEDLVAGNASQLKSIAFASKNGGCPCFSWRQKTQEAA